MPEKTNISKMFLFDDASLLLYDRSKAYKATLQQYDTETNRNTDKSEYSEEGYPSPFVRISKTDGALLSCINMPEDDKPELIATSKTNERVITMTIPTTSRIISY